MKYTWQIDELSAGQERRNWKALKGASIKELASLVKLDESESVFWLRSESEHKHITSDSEIIPQALYSVPNVIWSGNFLRPPGETRKLFHFAGTIGQTASELGPKNDGTGAGNKVLPLQPIDITLDGPEQPAFLAICHRGQLGADDLGLLGLDEAVDLKPAFLFPGSMPVKHAVSGELELVVVSQLRPRQTQLESANAKFHTTVIN